MQLFDPSIARAARAYTRLKQTELARAAKVASRTVHQLEQDGQVTQGSLDKILEALAARGVTMVSDEFGRVCGIMFNSLSRPQK